MKKLFIIIAFFLFVFQLSAQFKVIAKGPSFEEPEEGYAKILILKDRKTAYIQITEKEGIKLKMYGVDYKPLFSKGVRHKFGNFTQMTVNGCFEISGNITLIISEFEDKKTPVLYRIVINGKTGDIESQEELVRMNKITFGKIWAMSQGVGGMPKYIVRKDPNSFNYAIASFNQFADEADNRVEMVHYNDQHAVISRSFLKNNDYQQINILDIAVVGNKEAYALLFAYNKKKGKQLGDMLIANFKDNSESAEYMNIPADPSTESADGILLYNSVTNYLHVVTQAKVKSKFKHGALVSYYDVACYIIKASTKQVQAIENIGLSAIDNKSKELFGKNKGYSGILQNFYINEKGDYTMVFEGLAIGESFRSSHFLDSRSTTPLLEDIAIVNFDKNNMITSSALIPKTHMLNTSMLTGGGGNTQGYPLYHYENALTAQYLKGGNQYKSFAYINGKTKNYVLINDVEENDKRIPKGKVTMITGVGECDGFAFETNTGNILPSRKFVFDKPSDKKDHNLGLFSISDYDRENNVYATLKLEVDGRDRKVKVVWMQPE